MTVSAGEQARIFGIMILLGAGLGALRCAGMLCLRAARAGRWMEGMADLLFGAVCAIAITAAALVLRTQAVRLYVFAGVAGGMAAAIGTAAVMAGGCRRLACFLARRESQKEKKFQKCMTGREIRQENGQSRKNFNGIMF